jgi:Helix-turn-helix domain
MAGTTDEMLDVRHAAALVERHPETIRRWVWSGRLSARREGNRLVVSRAEVESLVAGGARRASSLTEWAHAAARARRADDAVAGGTAADLVLADRVERAHAGR